MTKAINRLTQMTAIASLGAEPLGRSPVARLSRKESLKDWAKASGECPDLATA